MNFSYFFIAKTGHSNKSSRGPKSTKSSGRRNCKKKMKIKVRKIKKKIFFKAKSAEEEEDNYLN